jgi:Na+/H+-dicarboxylate symporter
VVVPLVFASLASGVAQLGNLRRLGPLAARTFALFAVNMTIGVVLGLLMMNLLQPGRALEPESRDQLLSQALSSSHLPKEAYDPAESLRLNRVVEMFLPRNLLSGGGWIPVAAADTCSGCYLVLR